MVNNLVYRLLTVVFHTFLGAIGVVANSRRVQHCESFVRYPTRFLVVYHNHSWANLSRSIV